MSIQKTAENLLLSVKKQEPTHVSKESLSTFPLDGFQQELNTDQRKMAFWINCYNAFYQILRTENKLGKSEIYKSKSIHIAGKTFCLDDIEHGILRKYRYKYSLGYLPNIFISRLIKTLAVAQIDYRIHFALNCGAVSCPPIAFYNSEQIEAQLNLATLSFLETETNWIPDKKEIYISRIFKWFLADFGGKKGIRRILSEKLNYNIKDFEIKFKEYDWSEKLASYS